MFYFPFPFGTVASEMVAFAIKKQLKKHLKRFVVASGRGWRGGKMGKWSRRYKRAVMS